MRFYADPSKVEGRRLKLAQRFWCLMKVRAERPSTAKTAQKMTRYDMKAHLSECLKP